MPTEIPVRVTASSPGDPDDHVDGNRPVTQEPAAQRLTIDERHDVIQETARFARVVRRENVRMAQSCGDPNFPQKPIGADRKGDLRHEHLDRDFATVLWIVGEEDHCVASLPISRSTIATLSEDAMTDEGA